MDQSTQVVRRVEVSLETATAISAPAQNTPASASTVLKYYGKSSQKLIEMCEQYEDIFAYDPTKK